MLGLKALAMPHESGAKVLGNLYLRVCAGVSITYLYHSPCVGIAYIPHNPIELVHPFLLFRHESVDCVVSIIVDYVSTFHPAFNPSKEGGFRRSWEGAFRLRVV